MTGTIPIRSKVRTAINSLNDDDVYLSITRLLLSIVIFWRFTLHNQINESTLPLLILNFLISIVIVIMHFVSRKKLWKRFYLICIVYDTIIFSFVVYLTADPHSDTFFIFLLPLLIVSQFYRSVWVAVYALFICIVVTLVTTSISTTLNKQFEAILNEDLVPRWGVTIFLAYLLIFRHRVNILQELDNRARLNDAINQRLDLSNIGQIISDESIKYFAATEAHIRIVDPDVGQLRVEGKRGRVSQAMYRDISLRGRPIPQFVQDCYFDKLPYFFEQHAHANKYFSFLLTRTSGFDHDEAEAIGSFVCFPFSFENEVFGILTVSFNKENAISNDIIENGIEFARRFTPIIRNALELRHGIRRLQGLLRLNDLAPKLAAYTELKAQAAHIAEFVVSEFSSTRCIVYLKPMYDPRTLQIIAIGGKAFDKLYLDRKLNFPEGIAQKCISQETLLYTDDYENSEWFIEDFREGLESVVAVPLALGSSRYGSIVTSFAGAEYRQLREEELAIFQELGKLSSANLYISRSLDLLSQMQKTYLTLAKLLDPIEVAKNALTHLSNYIQVDSSSVQIIQGKYLEIVAYSRSEKNVLGTLFDIEDIRLPHHEAMHEKRIVIREDMRTDEIFSEHADSDNITSWLGAPLFSGENVIGLLTLDRRDEIFSYVQDEVLIVQNFATYLTLALDNAEKYSRETKVREAIERLTQKRTELDFAQQLLIELLSLVRAERGTVQKVHVNNERVVIFAAKANRIDEVNFIDQSNYLIRPISKDKLIQQMVNSGLPMVIGDTSLNSLWVPQDTTLGVNSWIGLPVLHNGIAQLIITLDHSKAGYFGDREIEILERLSLYLGNIFETISKLDSKSRYVEQWTRTEKALEDANQLAMIGLLYGEDIHLSLNSLGAAEQLATTLLDEKSHYVLYHEEEHLVTRIRENIRGFIDLIYLMQQTVSPPESHIFDVHRSIDYALYGVRKSSYIIIQKHYNAYPSDIEGLERQVRQMCRVVIHNAVKAMDSGEGVLTIITSNETYKGVQCVKIVISDTGTGIDPAYQASVFELGKPNATRDNSRSFGIGLAWSRSVLRWYGGDLYVVDTSKDGTTFALLVPCHFSETPNTLDINRDLVP